MLICVGKTKQPVSPLCGLLSVLIQIFYHTVGAMHLIKFKPHSGNSMIEPYF